MSEQNFKKLEPPKPPATNISPVSKRVPIERLRETDEFENLTLCQKLFIETYIASGVELGVYDQITATQTAYKCKNQEVARVMSYALMTNRRIVAVLNLHFAREPLAVFLETLDRAIKNKKLTLAQFKALALKARILGFESRLPGVNDRASSVIPPDVIEAEKVARKDKRKHRAVPEPKLEPPSEFDQMSKV
jgi:hypothetical protein